MVSCGVRAVKKKKNIIGLRMQTYEKSDSENSETARGEQTQYSEIQIYHCFVVYIYIHTIFWGSFHSFCCCFYFFHLQSAPHNVWVWVWVIILCQEWTGTCHCIVCVHLCNLLSDSHILWWIRNLFPGLCAFKAKCDTYSVAALFFFSLNKGSGRQTAHSMVLPFLIGTYLCKLFLSFLQSKPNKFKCLKIPNCLKLSEVEVIWSTR